jgi:N-acetylglutamate synthase-like GNAT family acetyltransferase
VDTDPGEPPAGAVLTLPVGAGRTVELRLVAVSPVADRERVGRRLLAEVADTLRSEGVQRLVAAASNAELALMALLQAAGFRTAHVEHDACTAERGWVLDGGNSGLAHRDLIWFEQDL